MILKLRVVKVVNVTSELESCMIKLPLLAFGFTIDDKTLDFQLFHVSNCFQLSDFSFLQPKFFGFWLAFQLWLFLFSKIKKNRQKAKSLRKIKLLAFRFYNQNFFLAFCFQLFTPESFWLLALGFRLAFQLWY